MDLARKTISAVGMLMLAAIVIVAFLNAKGEARHSSTSTSGVAQDPTGLDRRLSLLEQRFYIVENTLNRIEQQSRLNPSPATPQPSGSDNDIALLRAQVESLQRQMAELSCGLAKLDERTLSPEARSAREKSATLSADPCRQNADAPLRIANRP
jgi:hypothetical protein